MPKKGESATARADEAVSEALTGVFGARTVGELEARYAAWASTYDAEIAAAGYRLSALVTGFVARYVPVSDDPILDAGCGTGLAGDNLHIVGYRNLVGIDLSEQMLALAARLGIYVGLHRMVLGEQLDFPDDRFAAVVATGVFTEGHAPHSSFDELIRVTRPGGHVIFNVRDDIFERHGFREKQESLVAVKRWRLMEMSEPFRPFTIKEAGVVARFFVYRVL
jgi:SAM-dependent methyltransferase